MSEIQKLTTDQQSWKKAESEQGAEKLTHEQRVQQLADHFAAGDTPHTLGELEDRASGMDREWREEGFQGVRSYLDSEGNLILAAPGVDNPRGSTIKTPETSTKWRMLVDGAVTEVTIPPEWQGRTLKFRSQRGREVVYSLPDEVDVEELPNELKQLVATFGRRLGLSYNREGSGIGGGTVGLKDVAAEFSKREETARQQAENEKNKKLATAWDEAYEIEGSARMASSRVRKGLFESASKLEARKQEAYRAEIHRQ